jgi:hypothetical protein
MSIQTTGKRRANPLGTTYFQTLVAPLFPLAMFPCVPMNTLLFQLFFSHRIKQKKIHYNKKGAYCDPNILANNKEIRFQKPAVPNTNSSQTLKPLRNPHLRTRTIASSSQLPKLNPSQHISDYNVFYTRFAIQLTSETF